MYVSMMQKGTMGMYDTWLRRVIIPSAKGSTFETGNRVIQGLATPTKLRKAHYEHERRVRGANTKMKAQGQVKRTSFRLRQDSYDMLVSNAEKAGVSTREWLEEAILNNRTRIVQRAKPSADLRTLATQVNRMGNNLNQVAHTLNSAQLAGLLSRDECLDAIERLDHIRALLNETITYARQG